MSDVRMPTQKRSIEKRNRIIKKGFELMCENGYYNTTIPDIAKKANVSVGIIYQYFNDKKDIFIEGVKDYSNNIMYPMINVLETTQIKINNLKKLIESMIDNFIKTHTISKKAHEELMAMAHLDEDVSNIFNNSELEMTEKIVSLLENNNIHITNAREKVHIAVGLIDNLCHEIVYHKHKNIDYNLMKDEVINIIVALLSY
jgi:AcrR family transcriptional regulator